jgi:hypothetical protein
MMRPCHTIILCLLVNVISACANDERIKTINSPVDGVFYTVETTDAYTRVYARSERDGKFDKQLVLEGNRLQLSKVIWNTPYDVTLCLERGTTESFHSQVILIVGGSAGAFEIIKNHLEEHCSPLSF